MAEERRLGRGIGDLLRLNRVGEEPAAPAVPASSSVPVGPQLLQLAVDAVLPNPQQPRKRFAEAALQSLAASIRQTGVLQPVVVRRSGAAFELVAGERRWRAARLAGLRTIPAVVREVPDAVLLEAALVENLQREDLNPLEKAQAYQRLVDQFTYTQQTLADRLGQDRSTVANILRLLELPASVKEALAKGAITMGHARALLALPGDAAREAAALRIEAEGLSVRDVERLAAAPAPAGKPETKPPAPLQPRSADVKALEDQLRRTLGAKVEIRPGKGRGRKGKILLEYISVDDFNRLFKRLMR